MKGCSSVVHRILGTALGVAFAACASAAEPAVVQAVGAKTNERFVVTWNAKNGALKSLVLRDDADRMNWIEGFESWGEIRTNARKINSGSWTGAAFLDSEKLPFVGMREENGRVISRYDNGVLAAEVVRELLPDALRETYVFRNVTKTPVYLNRGDLGILTTFNDDYPGADECTRRRCSAHIWCGGGNSWVKAVKMGTFPTELALVLNEGSLDWYSVRRLAKDGSNDRGDILLHPDPAVIAPGGALTVAWTLAAYARGDFRAALVRHGGTMIEFEQETIFPDERFEISITEPGGAVRHETRAPEKGVGEYAFEFKLANGKTARANGFCSPPFDDLVRARVKFVVEKQQCRDETSPLYGAFVPYDNEDERPYFSAEWRDMNACRERTAMPLMLARYLQRHGEDKAARAALDLWERFACREFFDVDSCAIYDGVGKDPRFKRLYNGPQLIGVWKELYQLKQDPRYLDYIEKSIVNFYEGGGTNFYPLANGTTQWLPFASEKTELAQVQLKGAGKLAKLEGKLTDKALASVGGVKFDNMADALEAGTAITLLTNVTVKPTKAGTWTFAGAFDVKVDISALSGGSYTWDPNTRTLVVTAGPGTIFKFY